MVYKAYQWLEYLTTTLSLLLKYSVVLELSPRGQPVSIPSCYCISFWRAAILQIFKLNRSSSFHASIMKRKINGDTYLDQFIQSAIYGFKLLAVWWFERFWEILKWTKVILQSWSQRSGDSIFRYISNYLFYFKRNVGTDLLTSPTTHKF